jgi:hypothetical protein
MDDAEEDVAGLVELLLDVGLYLTIQGFLAPFVAGGEITGRLEYGEAVVIFKENMKGW